MGGRVKQLQQGYFSNQSFPFVVAKVLKRFQNEQQDDLFARGHRSQLVNKMYVQEINVPGYGNLLLNNGDCISISRSKGLALAKWDK